MHYRCWGAGDEIDQTCPLITDHCKYKFRRDSAAEKECKSGKFTSPLKSVFMPDYDLLYQYIEPLGSDENINIDTSESFKFMFECKKDKCNNDEVAEDVSIISFEKVSIFITVSIFYSRLMLY